MDDNMIVPLNIKMSTKMRFNSMKVAHENLLRRFATQDEYITFLLNLHESSLDTTTPAHRPQKEELQNADTSNKKV